MLINDNQYLAIIESIKSEIGNSQYRAAISVNQELILLYYNIGNIINEHKEWGNKFIENLSRDIKIEFPKSTGYSEILNIWLSLLQNTLTENLCNSLLHNYLGDIMLY